MNDSKPNRTSDDPPKKLSPLATAVWRTLAYVDVFDYPLTAVEIHRYLEEITATLSDVEAILVDDSALAHHISRTDAYYYLAGREKVVDIRRRRDAIARKIWPSAIRYGQLLAAMPFTRMVTLTGSLAMNNADENADIDYLIVAENGYVWLCRAFAIVVVRLAALRGHHLCPNYILAERAIAFPDENLYAAHEIVQMIPLSGMGMYQKMRQANQWTTVYLPNAVNAPRDLTSDKGNWFQLRKLMEFPLRSRMGVWLEKWEMRRKIRKFQSYENEHAEAQFAADWCKGHFDAHRQEALDAYRTRVWQES
jgi:hypothetical protein